MIRLLTGLLALIALAATPARGADVAAKPRLIVLTDIGNEPDDQMSLVRLLLYSNEIEVEGIVTVTSVWQRNKLRPDMARDVIAAYAKVRGNLLLHAPDWPEADALAARVSEGVPAYGLAAALAAPPSAGARALIAAASRPDPRPLWVALWGGASTLAQALSLAEASLPASDFAGLIARLRVYSISDQDDAGPWIRAHYPALFYVVSPSSPDGGDYARATWTGISGDRFYRNGAGADFTTVSNEWLDAHIRKFGPLGAHYPKHMFIMEGDTPSFLGLIPNGLQGADGGYAPGWGGWGGRYLLRRPAGEPRAIWTQGGDSFMRITSADTVGGVVSDQATIWRWREAFQNDFAARVAWSVEPFAKANHPPRVVVNGERGEGVVRLRAHTGQVLSLDASGSSDPDHQALSYRWFGYPEAGFDGHGPGPVLTISRSSAAKTGVTIAARCAPMWLPLAPCPKLRAAHLILAVTDHGTPALTRYRRIIIEVQDD